MASTVSTGWRTVTPGDCMACGFDDNWSCDGRGNIMCDCQACVECNILDAYGFHNAGCPLLDDRCSHCDARLDDGEGYDGLCGNCADREDIG